MNDAKEKNRINNETTEYAKHDNALRKKGFKHWVVISLYLVLYDAFAVNFAYFFGLWLRFDLRFSQIPSTYMEAFLQFAPAYTFFAIVIFYILRLYNSLWRFASFSELNRILASSVITTLFQIVGITVFVKRMPISYYLIGAIVQFILIAMVRFAYRYITLERTRREKNQKAVHNAMIIGAGSAGQVIIRELKNSNESDMKPVCIIDDNENKWGRVMEGIPIVGGRDSILEMVEKYHVDRIMFAIPTASAKVKRDFLNLCSETNCEITSLPGIYQLANGEVSLSKMKPVAVEDLLGRDTIKVDLEGIFQYIKGKTILVTGGGGSIGSELCRQIAGHEPKQLIIFDIYENNAYDIEQELRRSHPEVNLVVLIGSVRDSRRIDSVFQQYRPDIVYHAAAHKHVPLMETSPNEAIKNNTIGTYKTAYAALKYHVQRFVLISTDKAVNPTNIMGASKRLCEMVIQAMDAVSKEDRMDMLPFLHAHPDKVVNGQIVPDPIDHMAVEYQDSKVDVKDRQCAADEHLKATEHDKIKVESVKNKDRKGTQFVAVRFGNVLGSNGSVIPLFKKQIEAGGPVTVTHPDIIRYFMTIPEAVSLVLEAGTNAWGGEIFVLDMGEPVKIDTLARNLIRLSGHKPDVDIKIEYTGLRPGEKLFEEKLMEEEGLKKTDNDLIHIGKPVPFDTEKFFVQLEKLARASYDNTDNIVEMVAQIVSTFHPVGNQPTGREDINKMIEQEQKKAFAEAAVTASE